MPPLTAALRVLLSLALVLNGTGTAMAATRMAPGHAEQAGGRVPSHGVDTGVSRMPPCHERPGMASVTADTAPAVTDDAGMPKAKQVVPDCCKSANCNCACLQSTPAPLIALNISGTGIAHTASASATPPARPAPALPHLIRPPIG